MWEDWEKIMKQVAKTSQQFVRMLDEFRGPEPYVRVHDLDREVKVVITPAEGQKVTKWAVRVWEDRLFIRGRYTVEYSVKDDVDGTLRQERRSDEFIKAVRLPSPVEPQPLLSRKEGETVVVTFARRKDAFTDGWVELR
ncbi:hypothetical protein [Gorillibacterium sp. sgz5001074]|uniref:hypothetical protein n=1 Tax=Gorillibacterium sp. sgz5001074 TaxID=3446695 RepID=UPI003F6658D9